MQEMEILNELTNSKKRQRFTLKESTNLQIKRQSKRNNLSQNSYLIKSVVDFVEAYQRQNIFFYGRSF